MSDDLGLKFLTWGKHKGKTYHHVLQRDQGWCTWALRQENPSPNLQEFVDFLLSKNYVPSESRDPKTSRISSVLNTHNENIRNTTNENCFKSSQKSKHVSSSSLTPQIRTPFDDLEEMFNKCSNASSQGNKSGLNTSSQLSPTHIISEKSSSTDFSSFAFENSSSASTYKGSHKLSSSLSPSTCQGNNDGWISKHQQTSKELFELSAVVIEIVNSEAFTAVSESSALCDSIPYSLSQDFRSNLDIVADEAEELRSYRLVDAKNYKQIQQILAEEFYCPSVEVVPDFVLNAFPKFRGFLSQKRHKVFRKTAEILYNIQTPRSSLSDSHLNERLGPKLVKELKAFQCFGIEFGIRRNGRCLIGDEMGLGKTLQALGIASVYKDEWPMLIISPSSIRFQWRDQIIAWLSHIIKPDEIKVVKSGKDSVDFRKIKALIVSYDLIKNEKFQFDYEVLIVDESHYLKNSTTQRSKQILPMLKRARRAILLSGTPALNKPTELFPQLDALIPDFAKQGEFSDRYAEKALNRFSGKVEYNGYRLSKELNIFLTNTVMIRRLKKDVQSQLPSKIRSKVPVECSSKELKEISTLIDKSGIKTLDRSDIDSVFCLIEKGAKGEGTDEESVSANARNIVGQLFMLSGRGKIRSTCEHISYLHDNGCKFLVFAHHREILDSLEDHIKSKVKADYVRIDGAVNITKREEACKKFQGSDNCRIALLSITACSHGLNLTAAGTVVFAEMYWVPGIIVQAEDRCHRIGTEYNRIECQYLIAEGTIDELMWKILDKKWSAVTSTLDGKTEKYGATIFKASNNNQKPHVNLNPNAPIITNSLSQSLFSSDSFKKLNSNSNSSEFVGERRNGFLTAHAGLSAYSRQRNLKNNKELFPSETPEFNYEEDSSSKKRNRCFDSDDEAPGYKRRKDEDAFEKNDEFPSISTLRNVFNSEFKENRRRLLR